MKRIVITPDSVDTNYWKDVWDFRSLFVILAWRDIAVRYKQTVIGVLWSILRPLLTISVFWVLGWLFNIPSEGVPRIIAVTAATLPWQFVSSAFSDSANSLIVNQNIITKVYFPIIILPASSIMVCLVDFLISLSILIFIMIGMQYTPSWQIVFLPLFLLLGILSAFGLGILVAALNVKYRDFRLLIPFVVQMGLYISPIAFSSSNIYQNPSIPQFLKYLYACNPMVGVIDGFRWCITGGEMEINIIGFIISVCISLVFLWIGISYFRKTEKTFVDII